MQAIVMHLEKESCVFVEVCRPLHVIYMHYTHTHWGCSNMLTFIVRTLKEVPEVDFFFFNKRLFVDISEET